MTPKKVNKLPPFLYVIDIKIKIEYIFSLYKSLLN